MNDQQKKIDIVLIKGNKKMDEMFHVFDVFESWKRLCWPMTCELTFSKEVDKAKLVETLRKGVEEGGDEFVVAAFIPGEKAGAWVDPSVRVISNGKSWATIDKVLQSYCFVM